MRWLGDTGWGYKRPVWPRGGGIPAGRTPDFGRLWGMEGHWGLGRTGSEGPERGNSARRVRAAETARPGEGANQVLEGGGPGAGGGPRPLRAGCESEKGFPENGGLCPGRSKGDGVWTWVCRRGLRGSECSNPGDSGEKDEKQAPGPGREGPKGERSEAGRECRGLGGPQRVRRNRSREGRKGFPTRGRAG